MQCERFGSRDYLLGLPVDSLEIEEFVSAIDSSIETKCPRVFYALHTHSMNVASKDPVYRDIIQNAGTDYVTIDGIGVTWAGRLLGIFLKKPIPTTDLILHICDYLKRTGKTYRVFFLGGENSSAMRAAAYFSEICPNLKVVGVYEPPFLPYEVMEIQETSKILELINKTDIDILFVGFGAPKQEKWVARNRGAIRSPVVIPCGGMYGFYSGDYRRAPLFMRRLRLEWFFRFLLEPRKRFDRYVVGNFKYAARIVRHRLGLGQ